MQNIALIGCGMMGKVHARAYGLLKENGFKVKYVSDLVETKAKNCSELLNGVAVSPFEKILEDDDITLVDLCTPTYKHKEMVKAIAEHGKHVFCEKPIALTAQDADEMIRCCEVNGVKLAIGHVTRYFPEYVKGLQSVKMGEIGKPVMARLYRGGVFPAHGEGNWFNDMTLSGGVIVDLSIHDIDFSRQLFGEVESVEAKSAKLSYQNCPDNFDHSMIVLRFKEGAIVHIEGSWAQPATVPVGFRTAFEIYGDAGMIQYDSEKASTFKLFRHQPNPYLSANITNVDPYALELKSFIDSLNQNQPVEVAGEEGLKTLKIALAANISAREGRTVLMKELG